MAGKLMSSVSQLMHEQEARLILYLTKIAMLYGIKSGSDG